MEAKTADKNKCERGSFGVIEVSESPHHPSSFLAPLCRIILHCNEAVASTDAHHFKMWKRVKLMSTPGPWAAPSQYVT
jgi:hypothetical protein